MSRAAAEDLDAGPPIPPGIPENIYYFFHLDHSQVRSRRQLPGFLNQHRIPGALAAWVERGPYLDDHVQASVYEAQPGVKVVRLDCRLPENQDSVAEGEEVRCRELFLSFGIDAETYQLLPHRAPIQAQDVSGKWEDGSRVVKAFNSWSADSGQPARKAGAQRLKMERSTKVFFDIFNRIASEMIIVGDQIERVSPQQWEEYLGQLALTSAKKK